MIRRSWVSRCPLAGTDLTLAYRSDGAEGWDAGNIVEIPTGADQNLPEELKEIQVAVYAGSNLLPKEYVGMTEWPIDTSVAKVTDRFECTDIYGNEVPGYCTAAVTVGYIYDAQPIMAPLEDPGISAWDAYDTEGAEWGYTRSDGGDRIALVRRSRHTIGALDNKDMFGMGGWRISANHYYSKSAGRVVYGDGARDIFVEDDSGGCGTDPGDLVVQEVLAGSAGPGDFLDPGILEAANQLYPTEELPMLYDFGFGAIVNQQDGRVRVVQLQQEGWLRRCAAGATHLYRPRWTRCSRQRRLLLFNRSTAFRTRESVGSHQNHGAHSSLLADFNPTTNFLAFGSEWAASRWAFNNNTPPEGGGWICGRHQFEPWNRSWWAGAGIDDHSCVLGNHGWLAHGLRWEAWARHPFDRR